MGTTTPPASDAAVVVSNLGKQFRVPVRPEGLRASLRSPA